MLIADFVLIKWQATAIKVLNFTTWIFYKNVQSGLLSKLANLASVTLSCILIALVCKDVVLDVTNHHFDSVLLVHYFINGNPSLKSPFFTTQTLKFKKKNK